MAVLLLSYSAKDKLSLVFLSLDYYLFYLILILGVNERDEQ